MATFDNQNSAKFCSKFYCDLCDYGTSKKSSFTNHNESNKHKNKEDSTTSNENSAKFCSKIYVCDLCKKEFKDRAGIWRHKKKCSQVKNNNEDILLTLIKQNSEIMKEQNELKNLILKIAKNEK